MASFLSSGRSPPARARLIERLHRVEDGSPMIVRVLRHGGQVDGSRRGMSEQTTKSICGVILASDGIRFVADAKLFIASRGFNRLGSIDRSDKKLGLQ